MPEWFRRRYFYSKKTMLRTLACFYLFGSLLLLIGSHWRESYIQVGYYIDYRNYLIIRGNEAIVPIYGTILCSFIILGASLYLTIYGLVLFKKGLLLDIPINAICNKCDSVFKGYELKNMLCPKCRNVLEDLRGFYQRHPDKKIL